MEIVQNTEKIKWADIFLGMCLHARPSVWAKWLLLGVLLLGLGVPLLNAFTIGCAHCRWLFISTVLKPWLLLSKYLGLFCFLLFGTFALIAYNQVKAHKKMGQGDVRYVVDDNGISSTSNLGYVQFRWEHFKMWRESKRIIIVCLHTRQWLFFPRRLFQSAAEWETFRSILRKHLKKR